MDHTFIMTYICGMYFVELYILYIIFKKALSSTSFANMGLTLPYINSIEVLQGQCKGWEYRCYPIQTVVLPTQLSNDLITYFGKWVMHSRLYCISMSAGTYVSHNSLIVVINKMQTISFTTTVAFCIIPLHLITTRLLSDL